MLSQYPVCFLVSSWGLCSCTAEFGHRDVVIVSRSRRLLFLASMLSGSVFLLRQQKLQRGPADQKRVFRLPEEGSRHFRMVTSGGIGWVGRLIHRCLLFLVRFGGKCIFCGSKFRGSTFAAVVTAFLVAHVSCTDMTRLNEVPVQYSNLLDEVRA